MEYFSGKTAFITGGASGIGRALAAELATMGARIIIGDIDREAGEEAVRTINGEGETQAAARFELLDVTSAEMFREVVGRIVADYGRIDFFFNNAGVGLNAEFKDSSVEDIDRLSSVNLLGATYGLHAVYLQMIKQGGCHIINTGSTASLAPLPIHSVYAMSKFGMMGITGVLRIEGAAYGINASIVCPGYIDTPHHTSLKMVGYDREKMRVINGKPFPADKCAKKILKGVRRNKPVITIQAAARIVWWLYRIHPSLFFFVGRIMLKTINKAKI